jgi:hypothetical protein
MNREKSEDFALFVLFYSFFLQKPEMGYSSPVKNHALA